MSEFKKNHLAQDIIEANRCKKTLEKHLHQKENIGRRIIRKTTAQ